MKEIRIFGPPGCGKSTRLATEEIPNAVKKYGSDKIVVTSFTRTGAQEIASKPSLKTGETIPVNPEHVGTLHALCYRQMLNPDLTIKHIKDWNAKFPQYRMSTTGISALDLSGTEETSNEKGDELLHQLNNYRAKLKPISMWLPKLKAFAQKWAKWKADNGLVDFTDLIEDAIINRPFAPGRPDVIFVDEAQDFTPLQLKLVRSWGEQAKWIVLVGDDDQCIFGFSGASPDAFIKPEIDDKYKRVLEQSWRVPRQIQLRAMELIQKVSMREPKEYKPRFDPETGKTVEGIVRSLKIKFKEPQKILPEIMFRVEQGKTVMVLAQCAYMIDPIKHLLKQEGIPFGNKYRTERADWNPLLSGDKSRTTAVDLLNAFKKSGEDNGYWTVQQFLTWVSYIKVGETGLIRSKGNKTIKLLKDIVEEDPYRPDLASTRNIISKILSPQAVEAALNRDLDWLAGNLKTARQGGIEYPMRVVKKFGIDAINRPPAITIGTLHGVKGGEADVVILFPDISHKAYKELRTDPTTKQDELYRLFYVGMTRAKEELLLMAPSKQSGRRLFVKL